MYRQPSTRLILGGARSGKSRRALDFAHQHESQGGSVVWVATAQALDADMQQRIARHQSERPIHWVTIEAPEALAQVVTAHVDDKALLVIDCLTLWLSNGACAGLDADALSRRSDALVAALERSRAPWIVVSNEVGLGLVSEYELGRRFTDGLGRLNQAVAHLSEVVEFMVAGLPLSVKEIR